MSELISAKDVQDMLQVDRSTVYRMAEDGRLPAMKVGRQWRFDSQAIRLWMRDHQTQPPSMPLSLSSVATPAVTLQEHLPLDCVQTIQDGFAEALEVMVIITDMDGRPVTEPSNPCGLFTALHDYPQVWQTCEEHWAEMAARPDLTPTFIRSSLGLLCARALIRVGRELKGMVFIGGVAPDDWPPAGEELERLAKSLHLTPKVLEPQLMAVHRLNAPKRQKALALVQRIADIVSHIIDERRILLTQLAIDVAKEN